MKISVVMAVYNGAARLEATIASILSQTETDFELIVVDDGSTDDTASILATASTRDPRVRIICQENRGLTRALIVGCDAARAPYIARQDAGDLSKPERFAKQCQALDADSELAFVSCATDFVGPNDEVLHTTHGTGRAIHPMHIIDPDSPTGVVDGPSSHPSVMFRTGTYRKAGGYREEFYYGQDWDLWYRLAEHGKFQMIDEPLYTAVFELNTISANSRPAQQELAALSLAALRERSAGRSDAEILRRAAAIHSSPSSRRAAAGALYFIGELLRRKGDRRARAYFVRALRARPLHVKAWIRLLQTFFRRTNRT